MTDQTQLRAAGAVGCFAGVLRIFASFGSGAATTANELFYLVIDLSMLFAFIGIYASLRSRTGLPAFLGFVVATAGVALIVGPDVTLAGVDLYVIGSLMIAVGVAALELASWRSGEGRLWIPVAYGASLLAGLAGYSTGTTILTIASGVVFGAGLIGSGTAVVAESTRPPRECV